MKQFQTKLADIFDYILLSESHPSIGTLCSCGSATRTCLCMDCTYFEPSCNTCFIQRHLHNPLHWPRIWNGKFFEKKDISSLGYIFTFSQTHGAGRCPQADYQNPLSFIIVDETGVHRTKAVFCGCLGHHEDKHRFNHLLRHRMFPATVARPGMAFTFSVLHDFHLQTLTSKKSPYDYVEALRRKTINSFPDLYDVPVRCLL